MQQKKTSVIARVCCLGTDNSSPLWPVHTYDADASQLNLTTNLSCAESRGRRRCEMAITETDEVRPHPVNLIPRLHEEAYMKHRPT